MQLSWKSVIPVGVVIFAFGSGFLAYRAVTPAVPEIPNIDGFLWPNPKRLTEFELNDHRNDSFDLERVTGRWTLWYFGYTSCPDVCPLTLSVLKGVKQELAGDGDNTQYVFVSVDPARDTLEQLAGYVTYFSDAIIGVTASEAALTKLTSQLGVLFVLDKPDENGGYLVDHTSAILLTDPQARLVGVFQPPQEPKNIALRVLAIQRALQNGAREG